MSEFLSLSLLRKPGKSGSLVGKKGKKKRGAAERHRPIVVSGRVVARLKDVRARVCRFNELRHLTREKSFQKKKQIPQESVHVSSTRCRRLILFLFRTRPVSVFTAPHIPAVRLSWPRKAATTTHSPSGSKRPILYIVEFLIFYFLGISGRPR